MDFKNDVRQLSRHTNHEDEAGRGRGARLSMCPLQLGENKCIF